MYFKVQDGLKKSWAFRGERRKPETDISGFQDTFRFRPRICILYTAAFGFMQGRILELIGVFCKWCRILFCVCRKCWRGQVYCSDQCRRASQRLSHKISQRKYRQTYKGILAHRQAENRRRQRKKQSLEKKLDDAGSTPPSRRGMVSSQERILPAFPPKLPVCCHFCGVAGVIVSEFPRRGYG